MRYIQDITIEKAILHIVDVGADEPLLANKELELNDSIYEFLYKQIIKGLNDFTNDTAKFYDKNCSIKLAVNNMIEDDNSFVEESKKIAIKLYKTLKKYNDIPSCDLLVCKFASDNENYIAILKLDYQVAYVHEIEYLDDDFFVNMTTQETSLPGVNQKIGNSVFIKSETSNDYDMIAVNKPYKNSENEIIDFFLSDFIEAGEVVDNTGATLLVKDSVEKWIRKNLKEDIDKALDIREDVNDVFLERGVLDVVELTNNIIDESDKREMFIEELEKKGIDISETIDIDKKWVEKKMKNKSIKTDTGFVLRAEQEFFKDKMRFEIKYNGDGSVNYIIKNVRNIQER
ncbi:nucleoid-associated protein [Helicovermis profundi]|uniref:Nucleoid-associated protein n=1 Tax=Helicovermis profundi TaxID=3065157 RepID=A0AAU9E6D1_9FIRM|nr:nucleoid-associated protein [Clostridia bacterium S502]